MKEWLKEKLEAIKKWAVDDVIKALYNKAKELLARAVKKIEDLLKKKK